MTLLILLVSIAVLEYALQRPGRAPRRKAETIETKKLNLPDGGQRQSFEPSSAGGLLQLGRAVEQFGRGPIPQPNPQPEQKREPTPEKR